METVFQQVKKVSEVHSGPLELLIIDNTEALWLW